MFPVFIYSSCGGCGVWSGTRAVCRVQATMEGDHTRGMETVPRSQSEQKCVHSTAVMVTCVTVWYSGAGDELEPVEGNIGHDLWKMSCWEMAKDVRG